MDKLMQENEPLVVIAFLLLLSIEILCFSNYLQQHKFLNRRHVWMALFLASICPHFVKNAAWWYVLLFLYLLCYLIYKAAIHQLMCCSSAYILKLFIFIYSCKCHSRRNENCWIGQISSKHNVRLLHDILLEQKDFYFIFID